MTPETMPTDEKENLIEPTESNVRYWSQRIIDLYTTQGEFTEPNVERVIRELLTADTHYAATVELQKKLDEQGLRISEALNDAGAPMDEVDGMCPMTFVERIQWLHTEKGLADARLKVIEKVLTHQRDEARGRVAELESQLTSLRAEVEGLKRKLSEATDIMQRALNGAKELRLSAATWEKRYDKQTATAAKALEQRDTALAQLAKRQWVAFDSIFCELERATNKFPTWPTDPHHAANVLAEEVGELVKTIVEHTYEPHKSTREDVRTEAKQAAAMALRFFLSMDAYQFKPCDQHSQSGKMLIPPTQEPATAETCPTCGSADKSVRESVSKPNCGPPLFPCQDAWHTPDPLAEVRAHHAKGGRVEVKCIASTFWTNLLQREAHLFSDPALQFRIHPDDIAPAPASPPKVERETKAAIMTKNVRPPIGTTYFDWCAYREDYDEGNPIGWGRTEELAKADLLEQEEAR
jgi:regulator of replication initiation timing